MRAYVSIPKSRFIKIACRKCRAVQIVFNKASTTVKCLKCGEVIAEPTGGQIKVKGRILGILS